MFLSSTAFAIGGGIGTANVTTELRTDTLFSGVIQVTTDADVTAGSDGVILVAPLASGATQYNHVTQTSSIAAFPFPCKVQYKIADATPNAGFMSCSSATLIGFDQFGNALSESLTGTSSISETAKNTVNVFESISRVAVTGCNAGGDGAILATSADLVQLSCSLNVGLQFDIKNTVAADVGAVITACMYDTSASHVLCNRVSGTSDTTLLLKRSRVDFIHNSFDISGTGIGGVAIADGDSVRIRYRAPNGKK